MAIPGRQRLLHDDVPLGHAVCRDSEAIPGRQGLLHDDVPLGHAVCRDSVAIPGRQRLLHDVGLGGGGVGGDARGDAMHSNQEEGLRGVGYPQVRRSATRRRAGDGQGGPMDERGDSIASTWRPPDGAAEGELAVPGTGGAEQQAPELPRLLGGGLEHLGAALRHVRAARGLSQRQLARLIGVDPSRVSRLEAGDRRIRMDVLDALLAEVGFEVLLVHGGGPHGCAGGASTPHTCAEWIENGQVRHRDAVGRAFPAHGIAGWERTPPIYWLFRHGWPWPTPAALLWHYPRPPDREPADPQG